MCCLPSLAGDELPDGITTLTAAIIAANESLKSGRKELWYYHSREFTAKADAVLSAGCPASILPVLARLYLAAGAVNEFAARSSGLSLKRGWLMTSPAW